MKHCGKRRNCLFWANSSFSTIFSKVVCGRCVKMRLQVSCSYWTWFQKKCGKSRNFSFWSNSPLATMFSNIVCFKCMNMWPKINLIRTTNNLKISCFMEKIMKTWNFSFSTIFEVKIKFHLSEFLASQSKLFSYQIVCHVCLSFIIFWFATTFRKLSLLTLGFGN